MRGVRWLGLVCLAAGACAPLPPPQAVVTVYGSSSGGHTSVLAMPTTCVPAEAKPGDLQQLIDPILRLKLELSGYMITDARELRLKSVDRTDRTTTLDTGGGASPTVSSTRIGTGPTLASLSPARRAALSQSLGLTASMTSTLRVTRDGTGLNAPLRYTLVVKLVALPEQTPLWTVRCSEQLDTPVVTAELLANCAGDGVLAWRAPDAVIGRSP